MNVAHGATDNVAGVLGTKPPKSPEADLALQYAPRFQAKEEFKRKTFQNVCQNFGMPEGSLEARQFPVNKALRCILMHSCMWAVVRHSPKSENSSIVFFVPWMSNRSMKVFSTVHNQVLILKSEELVGLEDHSVWTESR